MVPYGSLWFLKVPYGSLWFLMVSYGSIWFLMVPFGPLRFFKGFLEFDMVRFFLDFLGIFKVP